MADINALVSNLSQGDQRALARSISIVENDASEAFDLLSSLSPNPSVPVIGITGPPGAGKSTLVNAIIHHLSRVKPGIRIAILAVDPTSPFTSGSLLGDRLRMTGHFNNPNIYIRSLATRGHLGGLSARTIEVVDILRSAPFDLILVETVGVGQSEALTRFNTASKPLLRDWLIFCCSCNSVNNNSAPCHWAMRSTMAKPNP